MTEKDRWQLWIGFIVVSVIVGLAGALVAVASLSRTGILVDLGFMAAVAVVAVVVKLRARRHPGLLVPPPLQGLDPDSRALVSRAVHTGGRADRPDLAPAVVVQARRKQLATMLLVAVGVLIVAVRAASLASGESGAQVMIDVLLVIGSLLAVAALVPSLLRARRAMSANSAPRLG
jgi:hypothetical protein